MQREGNTHSGGERSEEREGDGLRTCTAWRGAVALGYRQSFQGCQCKLCNQPSSQTCMHSTSGQRPPPPWVHLPRKQNVSAVAPIQCPILTASGPSLQWVRLSLRVYVDLKVGMKVKAAPTHLLPAELNLALKLVEEIFIILGLRQR